MEQPVNLDDGDDAFNYPWMNAGEMGDWKLTDAQAAALREYLLRGGFLMLDDFWGTEEWNRFEESMRARFPGPRRSSKSTTPTPSSTSSTISTNAIRSPANGLSRAASPIAIGEEGGAMPHWRGIYDDHGRVMVAMTYNSDVGDSWEWADDPELSGKVFRARNSYRSELRDLLHDALM